MKSCLGAAALATLAGCGNGDGGTLDVEPLPLTVRSPTGLVVIEWDPSDVVQRIDSFRVDWAPSREGPFETYFYLDHTRRALTDVQHAEGDRSYYRVVGLQGSQPVAESEVTVATSTDILPATLIEEAPAAEIGTNDVTIRFAGESVVDGAAELFTWRLDSDPWSQPTTLDAIALAALPVGYHMFKVRAIDTVGNLDPTAAEVSFTVDLANNPRVTIEDGRVATSERDVVLQLGANGGVAEMKIGEDPDFAGADWQPFDNGVVWTLSDGDGPKTLYARYRLTDGDETATVSDTIIFDTTPPVGDIVFPIDGAAFTNDSVTIYGQVDDVSPVTASCGSVQDEALAGTFSCSEVELVVGDNDLVVALTDAVGLQSQLGVAVWRHPATGACAF